MKQDHPIKDTLLFGWDRDPTPERPSTFFYPDAYETALKRHAQRQQTRAGLMLIIAALTIGGGIVAIFNLSLLLRDLL